MEVLFLLWEVFILKFYFSFKITFMSFQMFFLFVSEVALTCGDFTRSIIEVFAGWLQCLQQIVNVCWSFETFLGLFVLRILDRVMGSLKLCFGSQAESRYLPFIQTVLSPQRCVGLSYRFPAGLCICTSCVCCFSSLCVQSSGSALHTAHPRVPDQGGAGLQTCARHV